MAGKQKSEEASWLHLNTQAARHTKKITKEMQRSGAFSGHLPVSFYNSLAANIVEKPREKDDSTVEADKETLLSVGHHNQLQHFYPLVIKCKMESEMRADILKMLEAHTANPSNKLEYVSVAQQIKERMDRKYGYCWNVVCGEFYSMSITYQDMLPNSNSYLEKQQLFGERCYQGSH